MERHVHDLPDRRLDAELLAQLTTQRLARVLAGFDLSPWKLPLPIEVRPRLALRQQHPPLLEDDRRRHQDCPHGGEHSGAPARNNRTALFLQG